MFGSMQAVSDCPSCAGSGKIIEKKCKHCGGDGVKRSDSALKVKIPAGIHDRASIRLSLHGEYPGAGGQAGDLYVVVHIKPHSEFIRKEYDVYSKTKISYPQAVLGDNIDIRTLDGEKKLVIPSGTASHQQLRLKGLGIPHLQGSGRGDHYVQIIVEVPKKVSRKAKKLLEELKDELK